MNGLPNESKKRMLPKDLIDSPSMDEGISEESLNVGHQVLKKGPWTSAEDAILVDYVKKHGEGNWNAVQKHTGLSRCGKSCRLRWANHLRPNLKKGAFTQEEEQMIIELHAKMGNKWARMAAYLPGRTDNEIKNYWNTRIKRRQRAGLPLYPPNIRLQVSDTNQQSKNISEYVYGGKQHSELFQESNFDFHDVSCDSLDANLMVLPYAPPFLDIAIGNILSQNFGSHGYGSTNPISYYTKQPRDSEGYGTSCGRLLTNEQVFSEPSRKIYRTFGLDYPYDPDPSIKSLVPLGGASPSRHSLLNGTFSASSPVSGTVKLELPSLQYTDTVGSSWPASSSTPLEVANAFVESSATCISLQSECDSRRNSGLLEALIHEAQALGSEKKQASDKCSSSSIFTPNDIVECSGFSEKVEEHNDPISPLAHSTSSILSEYNYPICGSSLHEFPHLAVSSTSGNSVSASEHASTTHFVDKGIQLCGDCSRPDVLLGSMQLQDSSQSAKDNSVFNDAIAILLGKDLYQYQPLLSEAPSILEQGLDN